MKHDLTVENIAQPVPAKAGSQTPMQTFREAKHLAIEKTIPVAKSSDSVNNLTYAA